jgi:hypothetical protein
MVVSRYDVHVEYSYSVDGQPHVSKRIFVDEIVEIPAFDRYLVPGAGYSWFPEGDADGVLVISEPEGPGRTGR